MTPLYAGLMCTLLLTGTVAGLFGCAAPCAAIGPLCLQFA